MNGSENQDISIRELIQFAAGKAEGEVFDRVSRALGDPDHPANYLLNRRRGHSSRRRINPPSIPEPDTLDDETGIDAAIAESANEGIQAYLLWEREQLEAALLSDLPDHARADAELVYRSGSAEAWSVLEPYADELQAIVRDGWNWAKQKSSRQPSSEAEIASSLAAYLQDHETGLPFRPLILAVSLLRVGLDRISGTK